MKNKRLIGIIGAMDTEISLLNSVMENVRTEKIGMQTFYLGSCRGTGTVISKAGVGKVNAAACASAMILRYGAEAVINTGVAGGVGTELEVGDTVIADSAIEYDLDYGELGDPRGTVFYPDSTSDVVIPLDSGLSGAIASAAAGLGIVPKRGIVGTADRFVSDLSVKADLSGRFGVSVCEMEGAAIAHVCRIYGVPCAIVRSVSDKADGTAGKDFGAFAEKSAEISSAVILQFLNDLNETSVQI